MRLYDGPNSVYHVMCSVQNVALFIDQELNDFETIKWFKQVDNRSLICVLINLTTSLKRRITRVSKTMLALLLLLLLALYVSL